MASVFASSAVDRRSEHRSVQTIGICCTILTHLLGSNVHIGSEVKKLQYKCRNIFFFSASFNIPCDGSKPSNILNPLFSI
jgi:hypothetical protein